MQISGLYLNNSHSSIFSDRERSSEDPLPKLLNDTSQYSSIFSDFSELIMEKKDKAQIPCPIKSEVEEVLLPEVNLSIPNNPSILIKKKRSAFLSRSSVKARSTYNPKKREQYCCGQSDGTKDVRRIAKKLKKRWRGKPGIMPTIFLELWKKEGCRKPNLCFFRSLPR